MSSFFNTNFSEATTPSTMESNMSNENVYMTAGYTIVVPTIWGLIVIVGVVGNTIVIFTMCKNAGRTIPRSATNCYIINVALADLAFNIIVVPLTTASYVSLNWNYGETMCKLYIYIIYVTLLSTCLTLTAMTIDRYFAIVHPFRSLQRRTPKVASLICIAIWLASFAACGPFLVFVIVHESKRLRSCREEWPGGWGKVAITVVVLVTYIIPLSVIIVSYTLILRNLWRNRIGVRREDTNHNTESSEPVMGGGATVAYRRRKVAKMVAAVVILFAITWLPIHAFNLCNYLMGGLPMMKPIYDFKIFAHTLSFINSCVNPFVYTIMGEGFRKSFKSLLPTCGSPSKRLQKQGYLNPRRATSTAETGFNGD